MGVSISLKSESPTTIICHLFLVVLVVIFDADWAAVLFLSVSPALVGLLSSTC